MTFNIKDSQNVFHPPPKILEMKHLEIYIFGNGHSDLLNLQYITFTPQICPSRFPWQTS